MKSNEQETKKVPAPRLRFEQFEGSGEWGEKALEGIAAFINQKTAVNQLEANKYISTEKILPDFGGIEITDKKPENGNATKFKAGDLLLSNIRPYLKKVWAAEWNGGASNDVIVVRALNALNPIYLAHTLKNDNFINYTMRGAKGLKMPRGDIEAIRQYPVPLPPTLPEQTHIAACLSSLDAVIDAHTDKLDALRQHKRALMQQLFPQEGEKVPRLRFPEFEGAGEWEEKEVGEVFTVTRGLVLSMTLVSDKPDLEKKYPVYSSQTKSKGLAGYYSDYLYQDAITWTTDGANAGDTNYREGKFYCTNVCGVLLNSEGYANLFVAELLNTVTRNHVSYVGNPKLMNGVMSKIKIPLPTLPEQQRIAACLSSLDDLISAQSEKIDALKTFKRGLMQGLFPSTTNHEAAE